MGRSERHDLHAASERIQREVLLSMYACCPVDERAALGLHLELIADVAASIAERDPSILLNRAQGLGSREPIERDTIEAVVACYKRHGIGRFFFHVYPDVLPADGTAWLEAAGLEKTRGWMQFTRGIAPVSSPRTDLDVRQVDGRQAKGFAAIVCDAFGLTAVAQPFMAAMFGDDRWRVFMSFDGDQAAGAGAMFVYERNAYLGFGATDPAYRRRGSQGAIMAARIQAAIDAGCRNLFTETGEEVEGEQQTSYRNIQRFGFEPTTLCENWTPCSSA